MKAKTFKAQYELVEFNHYVNHEDKTVNVVDLVIESDDIDFIENEFNNIFVVDTDKNSYIFSGYELTECYKLGGGLIKIMCVK